jgi:hypothetical protein
MRQPFRRSINSIESTDRPIPFEWVASRSLVYWCVVPTAAACLLASSSSSSSSSSAASPPRPTPAVQPPLCCLSEQHHQRAATERAPRTHTHTPRPRKASPCFRSIRWIDRRQPLVSETPAACNSLPPSQPFLLLSFSLASSSRQPLSSTAVAVVVFQPPRLTPRRPVNREEAKQQRHALL